MTASSSPSRSLIIVALITIQLLFGINYVVSKVVIGTFPPLVWACIRIVISTGFMFAIALAMKRPHPRGGLKYFLPLIPLALLGTIINQAAFLKGLSLTTSSNSAVLNTLIPVFTLMIVTMRGQEQLTLRRGLGFFCAFVGVLVVRKVENFSLSDATLIGDLLTILNCLSYALFLSFGKKHLSKHDPIWSTAWMFLYGSVGITMLSLPEWPTFQWPDPSPMLWAAMIFAVLGATLATYFLNFWTLAHTKSSQVALFIYLQPAIAAFFAWAVQDEPITLRTLAASALIFLGMLMGMARKEVAPFKTDADGGNNSSHVPEPAKPKSNAVA